MSPHVFLQLYVIRVPLGECAVSCIYAFLPRKTQEVYEEMLQAVARKCEQMCFSADSSVIYSDFEQSARQAITAVLGEDVHKQGCFFHLAQATE